MYIGMSKTCTRVYVGHLPSEATERDLEKLFRHYGRIEKICMKSTYCFVEFEDFRDAEDACHALNGAQFMREKLVIEIARGTPRGRDRAGWRPPPLPPTSAASDGWGPRNGDKNGSKKHRSRSPIRTGISNRVIVHNLSPGTSLKDLKSKFRDVGEMTKIEVYRRNRTEGLIEFASASDMKAAIKKYDGQIMNGRKIRIYEDGISDVDHCESISKFERAMEKSPAAFDDDEKSPNHQANGSKNCEQSD